MEFGIIGILLGVALGFVVVMLLLSLVVTGVVQGFQSVTKLRERATRTVLMKKLTERLEREERRAGEERGADEKRRADEKHRADEERKAINERESRGEPVAPQERAALAERVALAERMAVQAREAHDQRIDRIRSDTDKAIARANELLPARPSESRFSTVFSFVVGPKNRVISPAELRALGFTTKRRQAEFNAAVTDHFTSWIRRYTLVCSLLMAFLFQVSATTLIKDLSTDKELGVKLEQAGDRMARQEARIRVATGNFPEMSVKAVQKLAKEKPSIAGPLEEFSGRAVDEADATAELRLILADHPERDAAVKRFGEIMVASDTESSKEAGALGNLATTELAMLDITFWRSGWKFYGNVGNIVGVLITGILLSFGAPFWYERLRELQVLRDALYSRPDKKKEPPPRESEQATDDKGVRRQNGGAVGPTSIDVS